MRRAATLLALLLVTGCTGYNNAIFSAVNHLPPTLPADAKDRISGNYKGMPVILASTGACPATSEGLIEVGDATVYFAYQPGVIFVAPVQPDGHVHAQTGASTLDGTVRDGHMDMTVTTPVCTTRYRMRWLT